ncbi:MAG: T9SS type A sorting domain-containing protein, partial [Maribacter sp.]|nr:T9SS type A sorting domain-containing protein [Maribacter sp.]
TTIEFKLSENNHVQISIFDVTGQLIKKLVDNEYSAGTHSVIWNGKLSSGQSAVSGVYFYKVQSGSHLETRKMVLEK